MLLHTVFFFEIRLLFYMTLLPSILYLSYNYITDCIYCTHGILPSLWGTFTVWKVSFFVYSIYIAYKTYINPGFVCSENQDNMVYIQKKNCIPKKAYRRLYLNNTKVVETFPICFDMIFFGWLTRRSIQDHACFRN